MSRRAIKAGPAEGRALDLTQCGPWEGFNNTSFIATDKAEAMAGADVVVMTAGVPRKPGQSREELININAGIVKGICQDVKKYAPEAVLVVVSNPLDAMVFVVKQVTGFPPERLIGSAGVLDSARFRTYLAMAASVSVEDVQAIVLGAHTDKDMLPITSNAMLGNVPATKFLSARKPQEPLGRGFDIALSEVVERMPDVPFQGVASTDVGSISWFVPVGQLTAATVSFGAPGHSWQMVACTGMGIGEKGMMVAAKALAATAIDLYETPALVERARADFKKIRDPLTYVTVMPEGQKAPTAIR